MAARTLEEFQAERRGSRDLYRAISMQDIWEAATKAAEEKFTAELPSQPGHLQQLKAAISCELSSIALNVEFIDQNDIASRLREVVKKLAAI